MTSREFIIPFTGLKEGKHDYQFKLGTTFFESFEYGLIEDGQVEVKMILDKMSSMLVLNFDIAGYVLAECDTCLDQLQVDIAAINRMVIKFGDEAYEETDEILVIPHSEFEIDVKQFIYEFITLALPSRKVHAEGECNEEVISRLEQMEDKGEDEEIDPRWAALKDLK